MEGWSLLCGGGPKSVGTGGRRLILSCVVDLRFLDHVNRVRYVFADLITGFASENSFVVLVFVSVEVVDGIAVRKFG
jgi:hypothetical protein